MKAAKEILYPRKRIGNLPGVDVGFRFYSRAEMVAVGFQAHWLNGIDFVGMECCKLEYKGYKFPLAVTIVISGEFEDDVDNLDVWYTGQGGNDLLASKQQYEDQILSSGNLALKVHFARAHKPYTSLKFPGLVSFDIAAGQEGMRVRAINTIDYTAPTGFTYTNSIRVAEGIILPANAEGCKCEGNCTDEKILCLCGT